MNAAQTLEIYKILNFHFKNEDNATRVVQHIQSIIDQKFEEKRERPRHKGRYYSDSKGP
jgi:hypothetical protein